jgi:hypothetical protein
MYSRGLFSDVSLSPLSWHDCCTFQRSRRRFKRDYASPISCKHIPENLIREAQQGRLEEHKTCPGMMVIQLSGKGKERERIGTRHLIPGARSLVPLLISLPSRCEIRSDQSFPVSICIIIVPGSLTFLSTPGGHGLYCWGTCAQLS